jgi:NAD(P)-dependent dehydrogenase (short-subunit alcohol dehydrogenase family)
MGLRNGSDVLSAPGNSFVPVAQALDDAVPCENTAVSIETWQKDEHMDVKQKVVVVTGGASGIGKALCERFAAEGASGVVVADLDGEGAAQVASAIGGFGVRVDVSSEPDVQRLVQVSTERFGRVDIFCSNAGIIKRADEDASNAEWQRHWDVNVMAHVYAARAALPQMIARGEGYFVHTASAAGLLSQVNAAPYSVTKHAAVGFAEWLSIAHGDKGIRVSCLCPQGVLTPMLMGKDGTKRSMSFLGAGAVTPEAVATEVMNAIREERFLVLPHPEVLTFMQRKAADYDRWLRGMRRLRQQVMAMLG